MKSIGTYQLAGGAAKRREEKMTFCGGMIRLCRVLCYKALNSDDLTPAQKHKTVKWAEGMRKAYEKQFLSYQPKPQKEVKRPRKSA